MTGIPRWQTSKPPWYDNQHLTVYDIPQIGPWVGRVGHVVDIWSNPCSATPEVWVYATWSNAPRLLLALFKPDRMDLVTQRWGGKHKGKPKRKFKIIEELNMKQPLPKGAGWAIGQIAGDLAQKVGWYMLVADATTDFAVHWSSTVYTLEGCRQPGTPYTDATQEDIILGPYASGRYLFDFWHVNHSVVFSQDAARIAIPHGYIWSANCSFSTRPLDQPLLECAVSSLEMVNTLTGEVLETSQFAEGYEGKTWARVLHRAYGNLQPAANLACYITKSDGFYRVSHANFGSYGNADNGLNPDP